MSAIDAVNEAIETEGVAPAPVAKKNRVGRPKKARAPVRQTEVVEPVRQPLRVRLKDPEGGRFEIPDRIRALMPGRTLEWKTHSVLGAHDPYYEMEMKRKGWEPVTAQQLPGIMPPGYKGAIMRDGMILMERPVELTQEARMDEKAAREEMIRIKTAQLSQSGPDEAPRDHPDVQPRIRRSYAPIGG